MHIPALRQTLCLITISYSFALYGAESKRPLTPEDYFDIKQVGSPAISPEGGWIAYTVRESNFEEQESETRIWMVATSGGEVMAMTGVGSSASDPLQERSRNLT